jgi:hypothetical protein
MNTTDLTLYVDLLKRERNILTNMVKYIPFTLWKIRIKKRLLLLHAEIEAKNEYLKTVKLHR